MICESVEIFNYQQGTASGIEQICFDWSSLSQIMCAEFFIDPLCFPRFQYLYWSNCCIFAILAALWMKFQVENNIYIHLALRMPSFLLHSINPIKSLDSIGYKILGCFFFMPPKDLGNLRSTQKDALIFNDWCFTSVEIYILNPKHLKKFPVSAILRSPNGRVPAKQIQVSWVSPRRWTSFWNWWTIPSYGWEMVG